MKKLTRIILAAILLLLIAGWGVKKLIIIPHRPEIELKQHLHDMRKAIDQFASDQRKLPQSLDALTNQGYIREIPIDPITHSQDWAVEAGEATADLGGGQGIVDVHSLAQGLSSGGIAYSEF